MSDIKENFSRRRFLQLAFGASTLALPGLAVAQSSGNPYGPEALRNSPYDLNKIRSVQTGWKQEPRYDYKREDHLDAWKRHSAKPTSVHYTGRQKPGSIVLDHQNQLLYLVQPNNRAMEYVCIVGRQGLEISGAEHRIARMTVDPTWHDPQGKVHIFDIGGPTNPLGVRGLHLADMHGVEKGFVIHGTNTPKLLAGDSGKRKLSHGCIRLHNEDVMDLYDRVVPGTGVSIYYKGEVAALIQRDKAVLNPAQAGYKPV